MSLQRLPPELFLQIVDHLSHKADRECLRITCRKLRADVPHVAALPTEPGIPKDELTPWKNFLRSHRTFVSRLFRPGNLYHNSEKADMAICGRCCLVRPMRKFTMDFVRNGYRTCEDCIVTIIGEDMDHGSLMVYNGNKYATCNSCGVLLYEGKFHCHKEDPERIGWSDTPEDSIHTPDVTTGKVDEYLCLPCHCQSCSDVDCPGWTRDWILDNPWHFCKSYDWDYCGECKDCKKIVKMGCTKAVKQGFNLF